MSFPAEHAGYVEKRTWHKVRWTKSPEGYDIEGLFDLMDDEDLEKNRAFVKVVETFRTPKCTSGLPMNLGKSEKEVDKWMEDNKE